MLSPDLEDFTLLLEVFHKGLKVGVISRVEVIAWADDIIKAKNEPDYFFIEISLSHDINDLLEILIKYAEPNDNPISYRVILGLIYHREPIFDIDEVEKMATLIGGLYSWDTLTHFENNTLITFNDYYAYYSPDLTALQVEIINFLDFYKAFTLDNFKQWLVINEQVLELLKEEEIKVNVVNEANRETWTKKNRKRKLKRQLRQIAIVVLFLVFFVWLVMVSNNNTFPTGYFFFCYTLH